MDARKAVAEQLGQLILANIEQAATIAQLQKKVEDLGAALADARADERTPSGATAAPDQFAGS